jgi:BirA family biotin operon repressor/biotin-[acetyl-CoA-carboxylase] ligase
MQSQWHEDGIYFFAELPSTQNLAKEWLSQNKNFTAIVAGKQTAGRGQTANAWYSPEGGLYVTWVDRSNLTQSDLAIYTQQICHKVQSLLELWSGQSIQIKMPNDLFLNNKKVAGILCERFVRGASISPILVGVGINLNVNEFPLELKHIATSLKIETGKVFDLKIELKELINFLS